MMRLESPNAIRNIQEAPELSTLKCTICADMIIIAEMETHKCESSLEKSLIDIANHYRPKADMSQMQLSIVVSIQPIKRKGEERNVMIKREKIGKFNSRFTLKMLKEQDYKIKIKASLVNGPSDAISIDYLRNVNIDGMSVIVQKVTTEKTENGTKQNFNIEGTWRINKHTTVTPDGKRHYMIFKSTVDMLYKNSTNEEKWIKKQFQIHEIIQTKIYEEEKADSLQEGLNLKNLHFKINPWLSSSSDVCTIII